MGFTRSHSTRERIAGQIMRTFILLFFFCSCQGRPQIGNTDPQQQQSIVSLQTGPQKQTQVESGVVKVSRAELNPFKQRGGAKLSRTSLKLPSSFNAETEPKPLCVMYYLSLLKI